MKAKKKIIEKEISDMKKYCQINDVTIPGILFLSSQYLGFTTNQYFKDAENIQVEENDLDN